MGLLNIAYLSDLHFEAHADKGRSFIDSLNKDGIDVIVLPGDILAGFWNEAREALFDFCQAFAPIPILFVKGNHEYWGIPRKDLGRILGTMAAKAPNFIHLDHEMYYIKGVRFLGTTLWHSYSVEVSMLAHTWNDQKAIPRYCEDWVVKEHKKSIRFLESFLKKDDIVISHFLPSPASISERYIGQPTNCFFVTNVDGLIFERQPQLWFHGHTHESVDIRVAETRILCNPLGHIRASPNRSFKNMPIVTVETPV